MKRALFAALAALVLAAPAAAQPPPAKATAAPSAKASPAPSAQPSGQPSALPSGHPQVDQGLPSGHPRVDEDGDDEPAPSPHGKAGGGRGGDPRFFTPPDDTVSDDPSLPAGTIVVTVKDAQDKPVPRAPVTLDILHSTVAKGDRNESSSQVADENGSARFDGLAFGSGHAYHVSTTRGPAKYGGAPFGISQGGGKRVTIHSYEVSGKLDDLPVAMQAAAYFSLREDVIQVEELISVYNLGPVSWVADLPIALPKGFKAFNKQDSSEDGRIEEVPNTGAALRGTFAPGRHDIDFRYQVPLDNESSQSLHIALPPRIMQARVLAEASKTMTLSVSGFPAAQPMDRDGKHLLITEQQGNRSTGGLPSLDVTLAGLPTPGEGRWIAVVLAVFAVLAGVAYIVQGGGDGTLDEDGRRDLIEAREALLEEIVALERAHKSGEVGPRTYGRVRTSLVDALARIVKMIEDSQPRKPEPKHPPRRAEAT